MKNRECVQLSNLKFRWPKAEQDIINIQSLTLNKGESLFIHGASGSGKSTLLNLIAGVLQPREGEVRLLGTALTQQKKKTRDLYRADHIGIIFQQFNLIPYLNVYENITLPCVFSSRRRERITEQTKSLLDESTRLLNTLGLNNSIAKKNVTELSTGQQQRVAAARALIGAPELIIADEPTSALDHDAKRGFLELLFDEVHQSKSALLFVSHDLTLQNLFDRSISLSEINLTN